MDLLKTVLGDELYAQVEEKINAHNGNEANKDTLIKLANLSEGKYTSVDKYNALEGEKNGIQSKLTEAEQLIADLKKSNKGDEALQQKVTDYEGKIKNLEDELQQTKIEGAIQLAIRDAKGLDPDYLTFKLKEMGEIALDDDGKIKGVDEKISTLKTQFPNQFEAGTKTVVPNKLPTNETQTGFTRSDILKMPYQERARLIEENPDAYNMAMKS